MPSRVQPAHAPQNPVICWRVSLERVTATTAMMPSYTVRSAKDTGQIGSREKTYSGRHMNCSRSRPKTRKSFGRGQHIMACQGYAEGGLGDGLGVARGLK